MPSRAEGGAGILAEAAAFGVPVVATRVPGNVGVLGADHPGLFPRGDAAALARLLLELEADPARRRALAKRSAALGRILSPRRETRAWAALLAELGITRRSASRSTPSSPRRRPSPR